MREIQWAHRDLKHTKRISNAAIPHLTQTPVEKRPEPEPEPPQSPTLCKMIRIAIALKSDPPKKEEKSARGIIASHPKKRNKENMYSIHASRHTALKLKMKSRCFSPSRCRDNPAKLYLLALDRSNLRRIRIQKLLEIIVIRRHAVHGHLAMKHR